MEQQFARAASGAFSLSVAVVDIDHFKTINDTYGHPVGDTVLRRVTDAAGRALRADDMIARLGGEEFLIILPEADRIEALSVAERVRLAVSESCRHLEPPVTVSIGIATFADDPTAGGLLARADAALYLAKSAGRNSLRMAV
jgi:diguanylate cyclase (GGDEF)-like protein